MGLGDLVHSGVETAFQAASDFVSLGVYTHRHSDPVYDPVTDQMTGGTTEYIGVRMIRTAANSEERESSPLTINDVKILIPAADLPVLPQENDWFVLDGISYNVAALKRVPNDPLWIIMARKK